MEANILLISYRLTNAQICTKFFVVVVVFVVVNYVLVSVLEVVFPPNMAGENSKEASGKSGNTEREKNT